MVKIPKSVPLLTYRFEGQIWEYYASIAGAAARMRLLEIINEDNGCYPACNGPCCTRVRKFLRSSEFTGVRQKASAA